MTNETQPLLACPFCGSSGDMLGMMKHTGAWFVVCHICEAEGPAAQVADTIEAAVEGWNTRTTPDAAKPAADVVDDVIRSLEALTVDDLDYVRLLPEAQELIAALSTPAASTDNARLVVATPWGYAVTEEHAGEVIVTPYGHALRAQSPIAALEAISRFGRANPGYGYTCAVMAELALAGAGR